MRDVSGLQDLAGDERAQGYVGRKVTPIGVLPCHWRVAALGDLTEADSTIRYGVVQIGSDTPDGVPIVPIKFINQIHRAPLHRASKAIEARYAGSRVRGGDVLLSVKGTIGRVGVVPDGFHGNIAREIARIRLKDGVDPLFMALQLEAPQTQRRISTSTVGSTRLEFSIAEVRNFLVALPPLSEQRKIAEILRNWDEAIERLEALRSARERRFAAFAQRLLGPSRAIGRHIPHSNWSPVTFGEIFTERQDRNVDLGPEDVVTVGKYGIRKQLEHFSRSVASKDQSGYWIISPGEFVYDPMSAYYGALGRYQGSRNGIVSPAYRVIRLRPDINPDFMVHLLRSHHIRFLLEARSSQGNKEGKRRLLQRDEFAGIEFNLPPPEVQLDIAQKLAVARRDVELTELELGMLRRQKCGLMQKLLTGEWRVEA